MNADSLVHRLRKAATESLPPIAGGNTAKRFQRLTELGTEDLSLARLAEAHFDAVAILAEAGRCCESGALYGVWAAEIPGHTLSLTEAGDELLISGTKMFCSGAGIVDRVLLTVAAPNPYLIDIDLHAHPDRLKIDSSVWKASAFSFTNTATVSFDRYPVPRNAILCDRGWYLSRPGFWHGAICPACCWAGGAIGLVEYARRQSRADAHALAHLGAMHALEWEMKSCLEAAGREIDDVPVDAEAAQIRALTVRHLIEQASTEILRRFARAYGPYPLAFDESVSRRYQELDIYLRQCHAERDLEALGARIAAK